MTEIASWVALVGTAAVLVLLVGTAIARIVSRDGYGHRPAPRTDDWSVGALPSHPYGV